MNILNSPREQWLAFRRHASGSIRTAFRDLKEVDWDVYNARDYLFTHDTIVASCAVEEDGYTIRPACWDLVNDNGNAWTNEVLKNSFKTFIGGENYYNHVQAPSYSMGKILDAVLREVDHRGEQICVVDILVATSRKQTALCDKIESGELRTMSMGATATHTQCSVCGKIFDTRIPNQKFCTHLENSLGKVVEYNGVKKKCAELCGAVDPKTKKYMPGSCVFIEASWVEVPAYSGAVTNYLIETPEMKAERKEKEELASVWQSVCLPSVRVADRIGKVALRLETSLEEEAREAARLDRIARRLVR